jgi:hypothetical protein
MDEEGIIYSKSPYEKSPWKDIRLTAVATEVRFDNKRMYVRLADEREISVPIKWFPLLLHATPEQRECWELVLNGKALRWEEINEDIYVKGLLGP